MSAKLEIVDTEKYIDYINVYAPIIEEIIDKCYNIITISEQIRDEVIFFNTVNNILGEEFTDIEYNKETILHKSTGFIFGMMFEICFYFTRSEEIYNIKLTINTDYSITINRLSFNSGIGCLAKMIINDTTNKMNQIIKELQ